MKNLNSKKMLALLVSMVMLFSSIGLLTNSVMAATAKSSFLPYVTKAADKFNAQDILIWAATEGAEDENPTNVQHELYPAIATKITNEMVTEKKAVILKEQGEYKLADGKNTLRADDAADLLKISDALRTKNYIDSFKIAESIAESLGIAQGDVTVTYGVYMPKVEEKNIAEVNLTYTLKNGAVTLTDAKKTEYQEKYLNYNKAVFTSGILADKYNGTEEQWQARIEDPGLKDVTMVSAKAVVGGTSKYKGSEYKLVVGGNGEYVNTWSMIRTKEPAKEFDTTLDYKSTPEGKKSGDTYLPPYYENENKDAKKDVDATAVIKSTTKEEIVKTNGVALTDDGKANSEGWYYPDTKDKTVIAKDYPFDTYNNPTDNGAVKEDVRLDGKDGGKDTQTPNIAWTLRRIKYEEKTNDDKSVTVTITYNLPIEEASIPDGWSKIVDEDEGIRRITRTFKVGEDYDKDVTVEQNGPSTATVTTPVKVKWDIAKKIIPQTGESLGMVVAGVVVLLGIAVVSYRKFRK